MSLHLSNHLPLLAEAPDGVQKLRGLILELAVRGKLVPQDPKEEPASELLMRIAAEKARLMAEGKIKKDKPLPAVGEDEKPFELPMGWEWVRLIQLGEFKGGKTPSTNNESYWHGAIPWVSPKDMKGLTVTKTEDYVTDSAVADGLAVIPAQSLLVVVRSGILRRMVLISVQN